MRDPDLPPANYTPPLPAKRKEPKLPAHVKRYQEVMARQALEMAGFKPAYARRALDATMEALGANRIEVVKWHGVIADERAYPDHKTRLQAADQVFKLVPGMYAKQEKATGAGNVTVEIITLAPDGTKHAIRVGGK